MFTAVYATSTHKAGTNKPSVNSKSSSNMRTGYTRRAQNRAANRKGQGSVKKIDYPHPKGLEVCFKLDEKSLTVGWRRCVSMFAYYFVKRTFIFINH